MTPPDTPPDAGQEPAGAPAATAPSDDDHAPRTRPTGRRGGPLAEQISKLEAAIAELKAQQVTEDVVADRVVSRLTTMAAEQHGALVAPGVLIDSTGAPLALANMTPNADLTLPPPSGAVLRPPTGGEADRRSWFLPQLLGELRLTFKMYFDSRYRISRTAQVLLPFTVLLFVLNYFLFAVWLPIPFVGPIFERIGCVLLGVFFYKVMVRELARYRDVLDYLNRYGMR